MQSIYTHTVTNLAILHTFQGTGKQYQLAVLVTNQEADSDIHPLHTFVEEWNLMWVCLAQQVAASKKNIKRIT